MTTPLAEPIANMAPTADPVTAAAAAYEHAVAQRDDYLELVTQSELTEALDREIEVWLRLWLRSSHICIRPPMQRSRIGDSDAPRGVRHSVSWMPTTSMPTTSIPSTSAGSTGPSGGTQALMARAGARATLAATSAMMQVATAKLAARRAAQWGVSSSARSWRRQGRRNRRV